MKYGRGIRGEERKGDNGWKEKNTRAEGMRE